MKPIKSSVRVVMSFTFLLILLMAASIEAQATIRRVPADYPSIQQAINASVSSDTVLVAPELMSRTLIFTEKQ